MPARVLPAGRNSLIESVDIPGLAEMAPEAAQEKSAAAIAEADALLEKKDYAAASRKYLEAVRFMPRVKRHVLGMPFVMRSEPAAWYNAACCLAQAGEAEDAIACLRKAFRHGYEDWEHMLQDPDLKPLHGSPVFETFCAAARARCETVLYKGTSIRARDLEKFRAADKTAPHPDVIWFDWVWTFEDELTEEDLEKKKALIGVWQQKLWGGGEGNFAIHRVTLVGGADFYGDFHTPKGFKNALLMNESLKDMEAVDKERLSKAVLGGEVLHFGFTVYRKVLAIPGRCSAYTWMHECGHLLFGCPEEYDSPHGCPCVMSIMKKSGEIWAWCDKSTHSAEQAEQHGPCWEECILTEFPKARHPGPGGAMPGFELRIVNAADLDF